MIVPEDNGEDENAPLCAMRIADQLVKWGKGEPIIFDDCYEHSVWNRSKVDRVLLLFDVWYV